MHSWRFLVFGLVDPLSTCNIAVPQILRADRHRRGEISQLDDRTSASA